MGRSDRDIVQELTQRVRAALADADATVAWSERLTAARQLRRGHLPKRCAWCGRLALGRHWTPLEQAPAFVPRDIGDGASHTICPDCIAQLERDGRSHPVTRGRPAPSSCARC